jgi:hypothetical protein
MVGRPIACKPSSDQSERNTQYTAEPETDDAEHHARGRGYVGKRFATAQELLAAVASMRVTTICDIPVNVPVLGYVLSGREKR